MVNNSNYYLTLLSLLKVACNMSKEYVNYYDMIMASIYDAIQNSLTKGIPTTGTKKHNEFLEKNTNKINTYHSELKDRVNELSIEINERFISSDPSQIPVVPESCADVIYTASHNPRSRNYSGTIGFSSSRESSEDVEQTLSQQSPRAIHEDSVTKLRFNKPTSRSNSTVPQNGPVEIITNISEKENSKGHIRTNSTELSLSLSNVSNGDSSEGIEMQNNDDPFLFPINYIKVGISGSTDNSNTGEVKLTEDNKSNQSSDETTIPNIIDVNTLINTINNSSNDKVNYDALLAIGKDLENDSLFVPSQLKIQERIIPKLIITDKMIPASIKRLMELVLIKKESEESLTEEQVQSKKQQSQQPQQQSDSAYLTKEQVFNLFVKNVIYENTSEMDTLINNIIKINTSISKFGSSVISLIYESCKNVINRYSQIMFNQMLIIGAYRFKNLGYDINDAIVVPKEYIILLNTFIVKQIYVAYGMYNSENNSENNGNNESENKNEVSVDDNRDMSTPTVPVNNEGNNSNNNVAVKTPSIPTIFVLVLLVQWSVCNRLELLRKEVEYCFISNYYNNHESVTIKELPTFSTVNGFSVNSCLIKAPQVQNNKKNNTSKRLEYDGNYNFITDDVTSYCYKFESLEEYGTYLIKNLFVDEPKAYDSIKCVCVHCSSKSLSAKNNNNTTDNDKQGTSNKLGKSGKNSNTNIIKSNCLKCSGFQQVIDLDIAKICNVKLEELITKTKSRSPEGVLDLSAANLDNLINNTKIAVEETIHNEVNKKVNDYQKSHGSNFELLCSVALAVGNGGACTSTAYNNSVYVSEPCLTMPIAFEKFVSAYSNKQDIQSLIQVILNIITHNRQQRDARDSLTKYAKISSQIASTPNGIVNVEETSHDSTIPPCVQPLLLLPHSSLCRILGCLVRGTKDVTKHRRAITKTIGTVIRDMALKYPESEEFGRYLASTKYFDELNSPLDGDGSLQYINTETLNNLSKEGLLITSEIFRQLRTTIVGNSDILDIVSWNGMNNIFRCAAHLICNSDDCPEVSLSPQAGNGQSNSSASRSSAQKDSDEQFVSIKRLTDLVDIIKSYYGAIIKVRKAAEANMQYLFKPEENGKPNSKYPNHMNISAQQGIEQQGAKKVHTMISESLSICMQALTVLDRLEKCCKITANKKDTQEMMSKQKIRNLAELFWEVTCLQPTGLMMPLANRVLTRIFSISLDCRTQGTSRVEIYKHLSECMAEMLRPMFTTVRVKKLSNTTGNGGNGNNTSGSASSTYEDEYNSKQLSPELPETMLSTSGVGTIPELMLGIRRFEGFICGIVGMASTNTYKDTITELISKDLCNYMKSDKNRNMVKISLTDEELLIIHNSFSHFIYGTILQGNKVTTQQIKDSITNYIPYIYNSNYLLSCYTATVAGNMIIGILAGGKHLTSRTSNFPPSPTLACYMLTRICVALSTMTDIRSDESCGSLVDRKTHLNIYDGTMKRNNMLPLALSLIILRRLSLAKYPSLIHAHMIIATTSNVVNQSIGYRYHKYHLFNLWISIIKDICSTLIKVHDVTAPNINNSGNRLDRETPSDGMHHGDISMLVFIRLFLLLSVTLHDNSVMHALLGTTSLIPFSPGGQIRNMLQVVTAEYIKYDYNPEQDENYEYDNSNGTSLNGSPSSPNSGNNNLNNYSLPSKISTALSRKEPMIDTCIPEWEKDSLTSGALCGSYKFNQIQNGSIPLPPLWLVSELHTEYNKLKRQCDKVIFDKKKNFTSNMNQLIDMINKTIEQDEIRLVSFILIIHIIARGAPCVIYRFRKDIFDNNPSHLMNLLNRLATTICTLCGATSDDKDKSISTGYYFAESMVCLLRNGLDNIPSYSSGLNVDADCSDVQTIVTTDIICRILAGLIEDVSQQTLNIARELCLRCVLEREFSIGFHPSGLKHVIKFINAQIRTNSSLGQFLELYPNLLKELMKVFQV